MNPVFGRDLTSSPVALALAARCIAAPAITFPESRARVVDLATSGRTTDALELHRIAVDAENLRKAVPTATKYGSCHLLSQDCSNRNAEENFQLQRHTNRCTCQLRKRER